MFAFGPIADIHAWGAHVRFGEKQTLQTACVISIRRPPLKRFTFFEPAKQRKKSRGQLFARLLMEAAARQQRLLRP